MSDVAPFEAQRARGQHHFTEYGQTPGQIGSLSPGDIDAVITSPPFLRTQGGETGPRKGWQEDADSLAARHAAGGKDGYGNTPGQIGKESAETYWEAVAAVYQQCRLALKPGGVMAVVVKDYVKAGKRVPLCDDTAKLLESLGFEVFERTRAHLVKKRSHPSLFGGKVTRMKERKSFFRRLAEAKGSPRIDWEEVIWARR
jgi:hypothetical protein